MNLGSGLDQQTHQFRTDATPGPGDKYGAPGEVRNGNGGEVEHFD